MEERLRYILGTVNEWLKFAEAKNAALLAVNGATAFGILAVSIDLGLPSALMWYVYFIVFVLGISSICCVLSFMPQLRLPAVPTPTQPRPNDNPLFFRDIARYDAAAYLETVNTRAGKLSESTGGSLEEAYAQQIVANSRVAVMKYRLFTIALWLTVLAVMSPMLAGVLYFAWRRTSSGQAS
jgi:hypothetical protein